MEEPQSIECPFCGYKADGDYQIMLHMETLHPENGESPFVAQDDASMVALADLRDERGDEYVDCPVAGCGEVLMLTELESHVEMHEEEQGSTGDESSDRSKRLKLDPGSDAGFDTKLSYAMRNLDEIDEPQSENGSRRKSDGHERRNDEREREGGHERRHDERERERGHERRHRRQEQENDAPESRLATAKAAWKELLRMPDPTTKAPTSSKETTRRRLGKSELGPHAHEKQMPSWLVRLLNEKDGAIETVSQPDRDGKLRKRKICPNMTGGIIPVLEQLLEQDQSSEYSYLCDPATKHVSKLKREGGFCGYRNIQMMCSYIIGAQSEGHDALKDKIPTIFKIQDWIEKAWDMGINATGRIETGGIRGTRKYIGTPDAQAMLVSLGITCDAQGLKPRGSGQLAYELLFETVENYFMNGCQDFNPKVRCTDLPSIYFQHPGHSMTIVGIERRTDGSRNLIVFDPMFHDASQITKQIGERFKAKEPADLLRAYRRGIKYLKKYNEFELLKLLPPRQAPSFGNIGSSAPLQDLPSRGPSLPTPPLSNSAQVNDDTDKWGA